MEYIKEGNGIIVRLNRGEEVLAALQALTEKENITAAAVTGIGAAGDVTLGVYDPEKKKYFSDRYAGRDYEICSLNGNISRKEGKPYLHLHAVIANNAENICMGGHVNECVISVTAEIFVSVFGIETERIADEEVGINLLHF